MKFVALISGGKDSCYNISYCQKYGHKLVAAASLRPMDGIDELDSFLYQTVGQDAIELVGQALGVPLYRRVITGSAIQTGLNYGPRKGTSESTIQNVEGDETEDLFALLQDVKNHHPDIEGVSVGAILSTYQRARVEHVCRRLGLTTFSYLWQRDQDELLQEMIDAGVHAILIKVAGIGLKPQHLGCSLAAMQPLLRKLNTAFGLHVCGEGGEYETLTLDCPAFIKKISLVESETVVQDDKDFATVAYLRIKTAVLEEKATPSDLRSPSGPPLLDHLSEKVHAVASAIPKAELAFVPPHDIALAALSPNIVCQGPWFAIGSISAEPRGVHSIGEETLACFRVMKDILSSAGLTLQNVAHINAFLASMDDFSAFNQVYGTMFGTGPPSRACVAVNLAPPQRVILDCIAYANTEDKRFSLHVQGISHWAPANIGPYSQAICVNDVSFISGQIGLLPTTMAMPTTLDLALEATLSLQHIRRIRDVLPGLEPGKEPGIYMGFIVWTTTVEHIPRIAAAIKVSVSSESENANEASDRKVSPAMFVIPTALPKKASVEIQTIVHSAYGTREEASSGPAELQSFTRPTLHSEKLCIKPGRTCIFFWSRGGGSEGLDTATVAWKSVLSVRVFHSKTLDDEARRLIDELQTRAAVTVIPVSGIYRFDKQELLSYDLAIVAVALDQENDSFSSD